MPSGLTNIISTKFTPLGVIISIDAGDNQTVVCDTQAQLEGVVDGDLTGHTIEWVQLSGDPVLSWNPNPNVLDPVITFNSFSDDMTFRLYIDRNTSNEKYDDVNVYKTPNSVSVFYAENSELYTTIDLEKTPKFENSLTSGYAIRWDPAIKDTNSRYAGVIIEKWDTNTHDWTIIYSSIIPNDTGLYEMIDYGIPYRASIAWYDGGGNIFLRRNNKYFVNSITGRQPVNVSGYAESTFFSNNDILYGDKNITRLRSVKKIYSINSHLTASNSSKIYLRDVKKYIGTTKLIIGPNSTVTLSDNSELYKYSVTRLNGNSIGG